MSDTEPCGLGICAANAGHDGTCAQASGWAEPHGRVLPPSLARITALCRMLQADGHMTPVATRQITRLWEAGA